VTEEYKTTLHLDGYEAGVRDDIPAVAAVLAAEERIENKKEKDWVLRIAEEIGDGYTIS